MRLAAAQTRPVDLIDPRIDTVKSRWFYFSSASRPFGMVNLSPDTGVDGDWNAGYLYNEKFIRCFSHIHDWQLAGVPVMPVTGKRDGSAGYDTWKSAFSHDKETVRPGYHKVFLEDYGITAELTSTKRVGLHRYQFPATNDAAVFIDAGAPLAMLHHAGSQPTPLRRSRNHRSIHHGPHYPPPSPAPSSSSFSSIAP